jgi:hypothetical protein
MELKNRIFPYPIYNSIDKENDYSSKPFEVSISMEKDIKNGLLKLSISWMVYEKALENEIFEGRVAFALHIECPSTTFYLLKKTTEKDFSLEIKLNDLNQSVQVVSMLIATKTVQNFSSPNLEGLFKNQTFYFEEGNILGIGDSYKINIKKEAVPTKAGISSSPLSCPNFSATS